MKSNPVVLITGASGGIGKALCEEFAKDGYDLILAARSVDKMQAHAADLQHRFKIQVTSIGADLESPKGAEQLHAEIKKSGKVLTALVNNAGYGVFGEFKCVFRPIVTDRFGNVTADFGIVTGCSGIVTEAVL